MQCWANIPNYSASAHFRVFHNLLLPPNPSHPTACCSVKCRALLAQFAWWNCRHCWSDWKAPPHFLLLSTPFCWISEILLSRWELWYCACCWSLRFCWLPTILCDWLSLPKAHWEVVTSTGRSGCERNAPRKSVCFRRSRKPKTQNQWVELRHVSSQFAQPFSSEQSSFAVSSVQTAYLCADQTNSVHHEWAKTAWA